MKPTDPRPGLYQKFDVRRIHGQNKPGEQFFVLAPTHDPMAREALRRYLDLCRENGLTELADDLAQGLNRCEIGQPFYPEEE
jgi:hypothetical protein